MTKEEISQYIIDKKIPLYFDDEGKTYCFSINFNGLRTISCKNHVAIDKYFPDWFIQETNMSYIYFLV